MQARELTVFAAASLKTALDAVSAQFEAETGTRITASYAGTSALARQIQAGAPADVFFAASPDWMDLLEADGRIVPESRVDLLGNSLVLIAPGAGTEAAAPLLTPDTPIAARLGDGRLAMALVEAVPAGIYGKAALRHLGQWADLAPRVAQTDNVRAALALVAVGAAPLGLVYATDARADPRVHVVGRVPPEAHPAIVYPVASVAGGRDAGDLLTFLAGDRARAIFEESGFAVLVP